MGDLTPRDTNRSPDDLRGARNSLAPAERPTVDTPAASLAEAAGEYAIARRVYDAAEHAGMVPDLAPVLAAADDLARRVVNNPTSRIRPAFDRRYVRKDGARVHPKDLQSAIRTAELVGSIDWSDDPEPWQSPAYKISQAIFHAEMDFLHWRIGEGLTAVGDVQVGIDYRLSVPVVPDNMTDREMAGLPRDIIGIEVHPEEKAVYQAKPMKAWVQRV